MTSPPPGAAVLYSRAACPLCFALERTAARAARRHVVSLRVVDVDSDDRLRRLYGDRVPVLELVGGATFSGRAAPAEVEAAFAEAARRARAGDPR